jgi:D-tyrosyl-tRNA(Tyr) deacylase
MRAVVQRVKRATVTVNNEVVGQIASGVLVLLGVSTSDTDEDAVYTAGKIASLRIFEDTEGKMNLSAPDVDGELLVVSQFTLYGDVRRGRRPSWSEAAPPEKAEALYGSFVEESRKYFDKVATGTFRAMMEVELVNDGPVTILIDSEKKF